MKCKHYVVQWFRRDPTTDRNVVTHWCGDCDVLLPIGPANDNDDRVKAEIRAAEIAADLADGGCEMTALECCGFNDEPMLLRGGGKVLLSSTSTDAGYLANRIAEHEDTP